MQGTVTVSQVRGSGLLLRGSPGALGELREAWVKWLILRCAWLGPSRAVTLNRCAPFLSTAKKRVQSWKRWMCNLLCFSESLGENPLGFSHTEP